MIRVTIWNEFIHEVTDEKVKAIYPNGIHKVIADFLQSDSITVKTAVFAESEHGLTEEVLNNTDVLIWWAHAKHQSVEDAVVARVCAHVRGGMGMIFLHSAHASKPFQTLLGTTCYLQWREKGDTEDLWAVDTTHPIAAGVPHIHLEHEELYCEPFDIPTPDELVFLSSFSGGGVLRSGCCWKRGFGKIFYFRPGHESYPVYYNKEIQTVIRNAVYWAKPCVETIEAPKTRDYK